MSVGSGVDTAFLVSGVTLADSQTLGFITTSGVPNSNAWESNGIWTVELMPQIGNSKIRAQVRCVRLDQSGVILQSGIFTSTQIMNMGRIFTPISPAWNENDEDVNNRLAVEVLFTTLQVMEQSITVRVGTTDNEVITDIVENKFVASDQLDLFIPPKDIHLSSLDLIVIGHQEIFFITLFGVLEPSCKLFIKGHDTITSGVDLLTTGLDTIPGGSQIPLCINGVVAKTFDPADPPCPPLDPLASIQISDELIGIYQSRIDALINQLGKNILLEFEKIRVQCPNCFFDTMRGRSNGIFRSGGPRPFARGRRCPWCKGRGFEESDNKKCIKALLKWNPKEAASYGLTLNDSKGVVRIKTFLTEFDDLKRAITVIVNHDMDSMAKLKVRLVKGPMPVGLREDRYCISFWELLDE